MITIQSFEFNYFQENTFLLYDDTREAVLIDCGCCRKEEEQKLSAFISDNQLTLKHLLCTHLHVDHTFGNSFIYKTYGLRPEAHKLDVEQLPPADEQARLFGIRQHVEQVPTEKFFVGNEIIRFGNSELQVLTVPGHSPGSVAFYSQKNGFVIVGDALFAGSIGRTDLWGGDYSQLIRSIQTEILTLPDDTAIYPGHGPASTVAFEKSNNPYI